MATVFCGACGGFYQNGMHGELQCPTCKRCVSCGINVPKSASGSLCLACRQEADAVRDESVSVDKDRDTDRVQVSHTVSSHTTSLRIPRALLPELIRQLVAIQNRMPG